MTPICYKEYMTTAYRSYLLRLWLESNDPPAWRAILESPANGERHGFANLQALFTYLEQETQKMEGAALATKSESSREDLH